MNVDLLQWFINFSIKKTFGSGIKNGNTSNSRRIMQTNIRKSNKRKVHSPFIDNIWGADLADMQLISKFNKGFRILLCVIDNYRKYSWAIILKDKKRKYNH